MKKTVIAKGEIQNLILANFERMVAFEQAAFNALSPGLKEYFEEKATESENNIEDLNALLRSLKEPAYEIEEDGSKNLLGTTQLFTGEKNITVLLKHVQYLEKAVLSWYKKGMCNLKDISQASNQILNRHYSELQASNLFVQNC